MKKAARFSIEILSLLLLMSHFLAGCSEEYGYNSEVAATESATPAPTIIDEDAAETVPSSGEELHMLTAQQGIAMTVGGETANGCYSLDPYPDASADIIYYDYLTQECIRLSADANLGHDPASTAYIPSFKGGARCFVVGDYLYVIKNGQPYTDASVSGNDPTARIYSMALDGSDRKIQEYGSNVVFNWFGGVAGNGTDALFTIVSIVDPQKAEVKSALVKFGRNLSGYEILYEWNDDVVANLVGTCDDSFIATITSKSDPTKTEWISISQERVLKDNLLGDEKESNITSYTIYDGIMYYTKEKSAAVYRYDILHDVHLESLETDEYEDFLPSRTMISCEVRDSHLILYLANEALYKGAYASVDLDTMQIAPLNLYATIAGDYVYLNLYGTGGVYASRDVTVYPRTTSDDQVWYITNKVRDVKKVYNNRTDTSGNRYTLNINTNTNNCNVYPDYSSNDADSRVQIIGDMARFCIKLARSGLYVHALTDSTHNVLWSSSIQYWNELS